MQNVAVASRSRRFWAFFIDQLVVSLGTMFIFVAVIATQQQQMAHLINVFFSDPLWTQVETRPGPEFQAQLDALASSEAVGSAVRALAEPFAVAVTLGLIAEALYYIVFTVKRGATIGKMLVHIVVHSTDTGAFPNWEQSTIRYFLFIGFGTFGSIVSVLDLWLNHAFEPSNLSMELLTNFLGLITFLISMTSIVMIITRPDRRGIHDLAAQTIVHSSAVVSKKKSIKTS